MLLTCRAVENSDPQGVLVIGSGNVAHNLNGLGPSDGPVPNWALNFDTWVNESLLDGRYIQLYLLA
jgi:4,5-DOPA dioxygenase extradiol